MMLEAIVTVHASQCCYIMITDFGKSLFFSFFLEKKKKTVNSMHLVNYHL